MNQQDYYQAMAERYRALSGELPDPASDTSVRLRTLAAELEALDGRIEKAARQAAPETAGGEALDRLAGRRGIARKQAARAQGTLRFTRAGVSGAVPIPARLPCHAKDGTAYETVREAVLAGDAAELDVPARAVAAGERGNAAAGKVELVGRALGLAVRNPLPFTGGRDAETDGALRARLLADYRAPQNGVNAGFYRAAAERFPGVASAAVLAGESPGSVAVAVAGPDAAPLPDELLGRIAAELNRLREPCASVTVQNATVLSTDLSLSVENPPAVPLEEARASLEARLRALVDALPVGGRLTRAALARAVAESGLVENWRFAAPAADLTPGPAEVLRAGAVTVTGWEA